MITALQASESHARRVPLAGSQIMDWKLKVKRLRRQFEYYNERMLLLEGKRAAWQVAQLPVTTCLAQAGFRVFSQNDEDGIIQFLISHLPIKHRTFVEFGVENYAESNTRFLLINDNWQGMVMDGSEENVAYIRTDKDIWRWDLQARCAFITKDNINALLSESGFDAELGLLSIDIDGNDYWVWEAIQSVRPCIVVAEYNSMFGLQPVSVPYDPAFDRIKAHHSKLYYGCSLSALEYLAEKKGYILVGSNLNGNNCFFVRKDIAGGIPKRTANDAYVYSHFRESRDEKGNLTYLRGEDRKAAIAHLPVVNVVTQEVKPLRSFL